MIFDPTAKKNSNNNNNKNDILKLKLLQAPIEKVDSVKFLGIIVDSNLNWKNHISYLSTKLAQIIGVIYKIRHKISKKLPCTFMTP